MTRAMLMCYRAEGLLGLYRGFGLSIVTFVPSSALWWGAYGGYQKLIWQQLDRALGGAAAAAADITQRPTSQVGLSLGRQAIPGDPTPETLRGGKIPSQRSRNGSSWRSGRDGSPEASMLALLVQCADGAGRRSWACRRFRRCAPA